MQITAPLRVRANELEGVEEAWEGSGGRRMKERKRKRREKKGGELRRSSKK